MRLPRSKVADYTLVILLLAGLLLVFLEALHIYGGRLPGTFALHIGFDYRYAETFMYLQEAAIVLILAALLARSGELTYLAWMPLWWYLLLDDTFEIHMLLGKYLGDNLGFKPWLGLRPVNLGELIVTLSMAAALIGVVLFSVWVRRDPGSRAFSKYMFILLAPLALFGVVLDMAGIIFDSHALSLIEGAGEMFSVTLILWFMVSWLQGMPGRQSIAGGSRGHCRKNGRHNQ